MNISNVKASISNALVYAQWNISLQKRTNFTIEKAYSTLYTYYAKEKPIFTQDNHVTPIFDLHIIVPVFNVEKYLDSCILSLINQKTQFRYHVTLINDGSTDSSGCILEKYSNQSLFTVMSKNNGGLSSARNIALQEICGKYVMFVDSDDMLNENAVQLLLETAFERDAEIVEGGHQLFSSAGKGNCNVHGSSIVKCSSQDLFGFAWGKVIRSDRLSHFCFPHGYLFEDTVMSTLLHPSCANVYTIPEIVYYYRENEKGITQTSILSPRCIDTFWIMKYCLEERVCRGQVLDAHDLDKYLFACYRNWGRTYHMPREVQESIFVITSALIEQYFGSFITDYCGNHSKLLKVILSRSFDAFTIMANNCWMI